MNRKIVRSFDLFDTLVGRLHKDPLSIFQFIEENFPFPNFMKLRRHAELITPGNLDDIYRTFQKIANVSDEVRDKLKTFEIDTELNQVFPILKNLKKVSDGDIIISDTYLEEPILRKIIQKIGLNKNVAIFASRDGKTTGRIWNELKNEYLFLLHLGDSANTDFDSPCAAGIPAKLFDECRYSEIERAASTFGHVELANLMRALRLQNPYPENSPSYAIWEEQSQINVPVLILYSLFIESHCKNLGKTRLLFSSRDCCLLVHIFKRLFPRFDAQYFFTSRTVYQNPSPDYIAYVKSQYTPETTIVDLNGSGKNCIEFFQKHLNTYPDYIALLCRNTTYQITKVTTAYLWKIEQLNYDLRGSLAGYENNNPIWSPPEYNLDYVHPAHACINKCLTIIDQYQFHQYEQKLMEFLLGTLEAKTDGMYKYIIHK